MTVAKIMGQKPSFWPIQNFSEKA